MNIKGDIPPSEYLIGLRDVMVWKDEVLKKTSIQAACVAHVSGCEMDSLSLGEGDRLYKQLLKCMHVRRYRVSSASSTPLDIEEGENLIPQFMPQCSYMPYNKATSSYEAKRLLEKIMQMLLDMGFYHTFDAVIVTDDIRRAEDKLGLESNCFNSLMKVHFLHNEGVSHPWLFVRFTGISFAVHVTLVHEVIHVLLHHLWKTHKLRIEDYLELDPFLTTFIEEIFTHMESAAILGHPYLESGLKPYAMNENPYAGLSPDIKSDPLIEAIMFLLSFPWFSTVWALENASMEKMLIDIFQRGELPMWTPRTLELAKCLEAPCRKLFHSAEITSVFRREFADCFGVDALVMRLFKEYAFTFI